MAPTRILVEPQTQLIVAQRNFHLYRHSEFLHRDSCSWQSTAVGRDQHLVKIVCLAVAYVEHCQRPCADQKILHKYQFLSQVAGASCQLQLTVLRQ